MHLIKNHLIRVANTPEPRRESQNRDNDQRELVIPLRRWRLGLIYLNQLLELLVGGDRERRGRGALLGPGGGAAVAD